MPKTKQNTNKTNKEGPIGQLELESRSPVGCEVLAVCLIIWILCVIVRLVFPLAWQGGRLHDFLVLSSHACCASKLWRWWLMEHLAAALVSYAGKWSINYLTCPQPIWGQPANWKLLPVSSRSTDIFNRHPGDLSIPWRSFGHQLWGSNLRMPLVTIAVAKKIIINDHGKHGGSWRIFFAA